MPSSDSLSEGASSENFEGKPDDGLSEIVPGFSIER